MNKRLWIPVCVSVISGLTAWHLNLFIMLKSNRFSKICFLSSLVFIACIFHFCFMKKSVKLTISVGVYTALLSLLGIVTLIIGAFDLSAGFILLPILLFLTPFLGLFPILNLEAWTIILIGILLFTANLCLFRIRKQ